MMKQYSFILIALSFLFVCTSCFLRLTIVRLQQRLWVLFKKLKNGNQVMVDIILREYETRATFVVVVNAFRRNWSVFNLFASSFYVLCQSQSSKHYKRSKTRSRLLLTTHDCMLPWKRKMWSWQLLKKIGSRRRQFIRRSWQGSDN